MLIVGITLGFVGGTTATILTLFIADHLRVRGSHIERDRWLETASWDNTSDFPAMS